jgi:ABC-type amino acid transport substrate-binding protein
MNRLTPVITRSGVSKCLTATMFAVVCVTAQAGPALDRISKTGKIVIAHRSVSVPFSYYDVNKKPVGYAMDLCYKLGEAVRKKLGLKTIRYEFIEVSGSTRIQTLAEGKADMECGSTTNNAERREKVAFTIPHYVTGARYLVRANSPIAELKDFSGLKLVSTKDSTPLKAIQRAKSTGLVNATILEAPDHAKAVEMVEKGEADGFAMDDVLLYGLITSRPDPSKLKVVGKFLTVEPLAIMLPKGDAAYKAIVDDEMRRLIYTKEAHAIFERWFSKPIPPANRSLNLPMNYLLKDFWKFPTDVVPG